MLKKFISFVLTGFLCVHALGQSYSLYLDGPVKWVNGGNINVSGSTVTIEALVRISSGSGGNIVSKHSGTNNINYLLRPQSFEITTSNGYSSLVNPMVLQQGVTYHIAATYNGSMMRFYVNGCLTAEQAWSGTLITNSLAMAIGQQSTCLCEQFVGHLDEVRVWNVARTETQIRTNMYNIANPNFQFNLLAYFKFQNNYTNAALGAPSASPNGGPSLQGLPYPYPSALAISHTGSNVICNNSGTGAIDVQASGGIQPYQFSLDGVNYQSNLNFSNLTPATYTIYVKSNDNCIATATRTIQNKTPINANLTTNDVSCHGDTDGSATVNPSGGNGAAYSVQWPTSQTGNSANNLAPGNYSVTIKDSCKVAGNELVSNGHFEQGVVGFNSQYNNCTSCMSFIGGELYENQYVVGINANHHHNGLTGTAQGGAGNFMMINGSFQPNTNVWCQTISVQQNTYYEFSAWVTSIFNQSPAQLQFQANGQLLGPIFTAPNSVNTWNQFFSVWYSGNSSSVNICIINQNTATAGNDFGIDNISFKACLSCHVQQQFSIGEPEILTATATSQDALCGTNTGSINVSVSGGTPSYTYSLDGTNFSPGSTIQNLTPGNYTVTVKDAENCTFVVPISVNDDDNISVDAGLPQVICAGQNAIVNASGPAGFIWSDNVLDGIPFVPNTTQYFVVTLNLGPTCFAEDSVLITVNPLPTVDAGSDITACAGENISLNATGATNYSWSNGVGNGQQFNLSEGNYPLTVTGTDANGCSNTDVVNVQIFSNPLVDVDALPLSGFPPLTVDFQNNNLEPLDYTWNFGIGANQIINNPTTQFIYTSVGQYWIFVSTDNNGCLGLDSLLITVHPVVFDFEVPNVFSPNNDADNEFFKLINVSGAEQVVQFDLYIVNRWGNIVFKSEIPNFTWDGNDETGNSTSEGVYFYTINYQLSNNTKKTLQGYFHLIR